MADKSRFNKTSDGVYYNWDNYFTREGEMCTDCKKKQPQIHERHCLQCHSNVKMPKKSKNAGYTLRNHYTRARKKCKHHLGNPPRSIPACSFDDLSENDKIIVREGIVAFYGSAHNHSWNSQMCLNEIINKVFDSKFSCSKDKSAAIIKGVFGRRANQKLLKELKKAKFITLSFDGSTIQKHKLMPIFASFYDSKKGLVHRLLNVVNMPVEKGRSIACALAWTCRRIKF